MTDIEACQHVINVINKQVTTRIFFLNYFNLGKFKIWLSNKVINGVFKAGIRWIMNYDCFAMD